MTLTEFLLARIAEDEEVARSARVRGEWRVRQQHYDTVIAGSGERVSRPGPVHVTAHAGHVLMRTVGASDAGEGWHIHRWQPKRVLAECEAKRRIVERHTLKSEEHGWRRPPPICAECGGADWRPDALGMLESHPWAMPWPCPTLCLLALPYVDHPDYDEAWRV